MRLAVAVLLVSTVAAGMTLAVSAGNAAPVGRAEWQSALHDAVAHGDLSARHSCAAVVVARTHAPPTYKEGSRVVRTLDTFLYTRCRKFGHLSSIRVGMSDRQVVAIAGAPVPWTSGPRCWFYRTRRPATSVDGIGFCFSAGRVATIRLAVHG
jgi:hypothetical protein